MHLLGVCVEDGGSGVVGQQHLRLPQPPVTHCVKLHHCCSSCLNWAWCTLSNCLSWGWLSRSTLVLCPGMRFDSLDDSPAPCVPPLPPTALRLLYFNAPQMGLTLPWQAVTQARCQVLKPLTASHQSAVAPITKPCSVSPSFFPPPFFVFVCKFFFPAPLNAGGRSLFWQGFPCCLFYIFNDLSTSSFRKSSAYWHSCVVAEL